MAPFSHAAANLPPPTDASTIYCRGEVGHTPYAYPTDDPLALVVVKSIQISLAMLTQSRVRQAFARLANAYSQAHPEAWYLEDRSLRKNMELVTIAFFKSILVEFPTVVVDYTMTSPSKMSSHARCAWDGQFEPCKQSIQINAKASEQQALFKEFVYMSRLIIF